MSGDGDNGAPAGPRWHLAAPDDPAVLAAATAAVAAMWPRAAAESAPAGPSKWRFSARWWVKGVPQRRRRPY